MGTQLRVEIYYVDFKCVTWKYFLGLQADHPCDANGNIKDKIL